MTSIGFKASTCTRVIVCACLVFSFAMAWVPSASAHTAFESSDPSDGAEVDRPVDTITITFTSAAEPAGDGFQILTPGGMVLEPQVAVANDERTFTLTLDEPLVDGVVGIRWSVRAGDAHPIEGAFSFTTTAPAPTPVPTPAPAPTAATAPTPSAEPTAEAALTPEPTATSVDAVLPNATSDDPEISTDPETAATGEASVGDETVAASTTAAPVDLDDFLGGDDDGITATSVVGYVGRALTMVAGLLAIGATALTVVLAPGLLDPLRRHRGIAIAAGAVAVGALAEGASFIVDGEGDVLSGQPGVALGLRVIGAIGVALGSLRQVRAAQLAGAAAMLGSFIFDGHTVTEGNRIFTGLADVVHIGAGAIWLAGIAILVVLARSESPGLKDRLPSFAARFSVIAIAAVAAVGVAGIALTATIIDEFSDIWATGWGQTLIAKTAFVIGASALGAYNHFSLVPAVERAHPEAIGRFARVLRIELGLLVVVGALTALLVAGAT